MKKVAFKDVDFAVTVAVLLFWGTAVLRSSLASGDSAWVLALYAAAWLWCAVEEWRRWRSQLEDERVRQIMLTSGYMSRQLTVVVILALILWPGARESLGTWTWPLVMLAVLVLPDVIFRRYLGLKSEELTSDRPGWLRSGERIAVATSLIAFLAIALVTFFIYRTFDTPFDANDGWYIKAQMKKYEAEHPRSDTRPLSERSDAELKADGIRRVPKKP